MENALRIVYDNMLVEDVCRRLKDSLKGVVEDVYNVKNAAISLSRVNDISDKLKPKKGRLVERLLEDIRDRVEKQMHLEALDSLFSNTQVKLMRTDSGRVYALPPWPMMLELLMLELDIVQYFRQVIPMIEQAMTHLPSDPVFQRVYAMTVRPAMTVSEMPTVSFIPTTDRLHESISGFCTRLQFDTDVVMNPRFVPAAVNPPKDLVFIEYDSMMMKTGKLWRDSVMAGTVLAFPASYEYYILDATVGTGSVVTHTPGNIATVPVASSHSKRELEGVFLQIGDVLVDSDAYVSLSLTPVPLQKLKETWAAVPFAILKRTPAPGYRAFMRLV